MSEIDKKAIGMRISTIRKTKGDTLEKFGSTLNADKSLVSRWEKGQSMPNPERLKKIAESANMTVSELLYGDYETYLHLKIMELAPKYIKNYDAYSSFHDSVTDEAVQIAKHTLSENDYNLSEQTLQRFIELAYEMCRPDRTFYEDVGGDSDTPIEPYKMLAIATVGVDLTGDIEKTILEIAKNNKKKAGKYIDAMNKLPAEFQKLLVHFMLLPRGSKNTVNELLKSLFYDTRTKD